MTLTNKTLEHFLEWKVNNKNLSTIEVLDFKYLSTTSQNALIIEFFDSVGIYINVFYKYIWRVEIRDSQSSLLSTLDYAVFDTRQEATIQAITKANDIYNVRYSKQKQAK